MAVWVAGSVAFAAVALAPWVLHRILGRADVEERAAIDRDAPPAHA